MTGGNVVSTEPDAVTERLIDEAARMVAEQGLAGLSLRRLASASGTSTMSVYTRFGSKYELLAAMRREGFRRLGAHIAATPADVAPLARLAAVGHAYRAAALASPQLYGLMFGPLPSGVELSQHDLVAAAATYAPLVDGTRRAVAAALLVGDADRIARHLWAVAHGMVSLELSGQFHEDEDAARKSYEEALAFAAAPFLRHAGE